MSGSEGTIPTATPYNLIGVWTRYSSWTARITVLLDYYNIPYEASYFNLTPEGKAELKKLSPNGLCPVLIDNSLSSAIRINDSLAISEYLAESHPSLPLWPKDRQLRALARSAAAEMHSGYSAVRNEFTANFVGKYEGEIPISDAAKKDIQRFLTLWGESRRFTKQRLQELGEEDGGFLFGEFGIADAFFWPVLWRFRTYALPLSGASPEAVEWVAKMWGDEKLQEVGRGYYEQVKNPDTKMEQYDDVFKGTEGITYSNFDAGWSFTRRHAYARVAGI